uniref:Alpha 1,4-glycosyltransferase domain-containing protein n=2 Tax=Clastoptera arizonana TaxID=38151 RepID=A0A1B6DZ23_9HEMI
MPRTRRIYFVVVLFFIIIFTLTQNMDKVFYRVWYLNGFINTLEANNISCYDNKTSNTLEELHHPTFDSSIFFLETSCHSRPGVHLLPRQACAVESAAKMNPNSDVYVLFPSPIIDNMSLSSPAVQQLYKYPNIKLRHINMETYFKNTPLETWYSFGMLRTSRWPRSHASDVLRYLTLWKFGGVYLDLDVVVIRSLKNMLNFAGAESGEDVAAGVLSFSHDKNGNDMALSCLTELKKDFRGYDWGYNGPGVITRMLKKKCQTKQIQHMTPETCNGFTVYAPNYFYPVPWRQWNLYFDSNSLNSTMRTIHNSYAIHVWNKFSILANITVGSKQPYGIIASQFCPQVYNNIGAIF